MTLNACTDNNQQSFSIFHYQNLLRICRYRTFWQLATAQLNCSIMLQRSLLKCLLEVGKGLLIRGSVETLTSKVYV